MIYDLLSPLGALLNAASLICLILGFGAVKRGDKPGHKKYMLSALAAFLAYLATYLLYRANVPVQPFSGQGPIRTVYFAILITHSLLAAAVPAFGAYLLIMAFGGRFDRHKAAARIAFPVWVYVSLTGILIYLLLFHIYPVP